MKTNPYDLNAMAERRRRAEAKMAKCPRCGHNPATDHLKMQEELAQARAEAGRRRKGIMDAVAAMGSPDDGKERLREACRDMVDALRFIRDHDNRGLIAQHGDALDAGIKALAASEKGTDECPKPA